MYAVESIDEADVGRHDGWYVLESLRELELWQGMRHEVPITLVWQDWWHLEQDLRNRLGDQADASYGWPLPSDTVQIWPMTCRKCGADLPDIATRPKREEQAQLRLLPDTEGA